MFKGSTQVPKAFAEGKSKKQGDNQSTGNELFYHGNKIAEWKADGLYISNGGYVTYSRNGTVIPGSKTTKDKLNALPCVRLWQAKCKWYLNGKEWNGEWIKIDGVTPPVIDMSKAGEVFDTSTKYVRTDGWRGYSRPQFACCGANDTGMYSDSPCPSNVREAELKAIAELLIKEGIKSKEVVCQSSNVFCVHVYLVPIKKYVDRAREIVKQYIKENRTQLLYAVS